MVVRGHMVQVAIYGIGQAVVADIDHNEQIFSADRLSDNSFGLPGSETGAVAVDQVIVQLIAGKKRRIQRFF